MYRYDLAELLLKLRQYDKAERVLGAVLEEEGGMYSFLLFYFGEDSRFWHFLHDDNVWKNCKSCECIPINVFKKYTNELWYDFYMTAKKSKETIALKLY